MSSNLCSAEELLEHKCDHCQTIGEGYTKCDILDRGAEDGCLWCRLLVACIEWMKPTLQTGHTVDMASITRGGHVAINCYIPHVQVLHFDCLRLSSEPGVATTLDLGETMRLLPGQTSSDKTFEKIKEWLHECVSGHSGCHRLDRERPPGLLRGIRFLRICEESVILEEAAQPYCYGCLSHCWGSGQNLVKTTSHSKVSHMTDGVPLWRLPKTYLDAVEACKKLNIEYLWIDSLCIVQDDHQDWCEQAARMAEVYENAYVTIAAVKAYDASEGLFAQTHWPYLGQSLPGFPWIHIRQSVIIPDARHPRWKDRNDDDWPLYKRGWTFQELSLSTRVIHFGSQEVMWDCWHQCVCESRPNEFFTPTSSFVPNFISMRLADNMSEEFQRQWYLAVSGYSWRNLTFHEDTLPAIAAIASRMQTSQPYKRYLAGLWEETLPFDLLWQIPWLYKDRHHSEIGLITTRRAPTWSWSSLSHPVTWSNLMDLEFQQTLDCTKVVDISYSTKGPPILGNIQEAAIKFQAPLIRLCDVRSTNHGELSRSDPEYFSKVIEATQIAQPDLTSPMFQLEVNNCVWDRINGNEDYAAQCSGAMALPLIYGRNMEATAGYEQPPNALLVLPTDKEGMFSRVGTCYIDLAGAWVVRSHADRGGET